MVMLREGSWFGEIAILKETTRTASIRTITACDLFILQKEDFQDILSAHPNSEFEKAIKSEVDRRITAIDFRRQSTGGDGRSPDSPQIKIEVHAPGGGMHQLGQAGSNAYIPQIMGGATIEIEACEEWRSVGVKKWGKLRGAFQAQAMMRRLSSNISPNNQNSIFPQVPPNGPSRLLSPDSAAAQSRFPNTIATAISAFNAPDTPDKGEPDRGAFATPDQPNLVRRTESKGETSPTKDMLAQSFPFQRDTPPEGSPATTPPAASVPVVRGPTVIAPTSVPDTATTIPLGPMASNKQLVDDPPPPADPAGVVRDS